MNARPVIAVACGVLVDAGGEVLVAQRPQGKVAAGKWEFPGGKIEPGEAPLQALARELREELGIEVRKARRLIRFRHEYVDRVVRLDTWVVHRYEGEPHPHEGQTFAWIQPDNLHALDTLPTVAPIVHALRLPSHYVFTPPNVTEAVVRAGLPKLPAGCLLRLRIPALEDEAYAEIAGRLVQPAAECGIRLMLDRDPRMVAQVGAAGFHATQHALLMQRRSRPLPRPLLFGASVHDSFGVGEAYRLGADFAVLSPVLLTATHPHTQGLGWERFEDLVGEVPMPVYALGGVGPQQLDVAFEHRAQGVAGISAYWSR
ncbi:MAG: Nudix family hydrolase [Nevskia sp.]|nr:Nudix family hydrolase [Nevskia sp.]